VDFRNILVWKGN